MSLKSALRRSLGTTNYQRAAIIGRCLRDLRGSFRAGSRGRLPSAGAPVPVRIIRDAIERLGVGRGDLLLVHSSMNDLSRGWPAAESDTPVNLIEYTIAVLDVLRDTVGPEG